VLVVDDTILVVEYSINWIDGMATVAICLAKLAPRLDAHVDPSNDRLFRRKYMQRFLRYFRLIMLVGLLPLAITLTITGGSRTANAQSVLAVDCANDLTTIFSNVTPGNDRLAACLISYEDKIYPRCRFLLILRRANSPSAQKAYEALQKHEVVTSSNTAQSWRRAHH
jgi:hypothetical protein